VQIYAPQTAEEAAEILRTAVKDRTKICIRGFSSQSPAVQNPVTLCTRNFKHIEPGHPGDLIVSLGAGFPFMQLAQFLPDEVVPPEYAGTLGGCLCGNRTLPAHRFLIPRILALTFIRTTGEIIKLGAKSVKDVAGYKIIPLFAGSRGRLGLVMDITINTASIFRDLRLRIPLSDYKPSPSMKTLIEGLIRTFDPAGILS